MNIFYKITARSLQKNKTRTVVTIIGVILSAALITGVASIVSSLQDYLIRNTISATGNWHMAYQLQGTQVQELALEPEVEQALLMQHLGDTVLDLPLGAGPELPKGVNALSDEVMQEIPLTVSQGALPQSENELIVPEWMSELYAIGGRYTFAIGDEAVPAQIDPENPALGSGGWEIANPKGCAISPSWGTTKAL